MPKHCPAAMWISETPYDASKRMANLCGGAVEVHRWISETPCDIPRRRTTNKTIQRLDLLCGCACVLKVRVRACVYGLWCRVWCGV